MPHWRAWDQRFVLMLIALAAACGGESKGTSGAHGGVGGGDSNGRQEPPRLILGALAEGNGVLVAAGAEYTESLQWKGVIFRSEDGVDWTKVASELETVPSDIEFGNGHFVALARMFDSLGFVMSRSYVSDDGALWTEHELPESISEIGAGLAFGNGLFVAAGLEGHLSSTDGKTWRAYGPAVADASSSGVEFAARRFLSWSMVNLVVYFGDGETWQSAPLDLDWQTKLDAVGTVNDGFVGIVSQNCCAGEAPSTYRRAASVNGVDWNVETSDTKAPSVPVIDDGTACIARGLSGIVAGATCDAVGSIIVQSENYNGDALAALGRYFVVGASFSGILSSSDGIEWAKVPLQ